MTTTQDGELAIEAEGLRLGFGSATQRVWDVVGRGPRRCRRGPSTAVLGPNGAGKTTNDPDARDAAGAGRRLGCAWLGQRHRRGARGGAGAGGASPARWRRTSGPHRAREPGADRPVWSGLRTPGGPRARRRALDRVRPRGGGRPAGRRPTRGGMRRRLDIAASIVVTPRLMFLDEPTTGLDPRSPNGVWDIVRPRRPAAPRSCSAPSTSTRPTSSPTASRSSTTAVIAEGRPAS